MDTYEELINKFEEIRKRHEKLLAKAATINYNLNEKPEIEGEALRLDSDIQQLIREYSEKIRKSPFKVKDRARLQVLNERLTTFANSWRIRVLSLWDAESKKELEQIKNRHTQLFVAVGAEGFNNKKKYLDQVFKLQEDIDALVLKFETEIIRRSRKKWPYEKLDAIVEETRNFRSKSRKVWSAVRSRELDFSAVKQ